MTRYTYNETGNILRDGKPVGMPYWLWQIVSGGASEVPGDVLQRNTIAAMADANIRARLDAEVMMRNIRDGARGELQLNFKAAGKRLGASAKPMAAWVASRDAAWLLARLAESDVEIPGVGTLTAGDVQFVGGKMSGQMGAFAYVVESGQ